MPAFPEISETSETSSPNAKPQTKIQIRSGELAMLLGGIDLRNRKRSKRYSLEQ